MNSGNHQRKGVGYLILIGMFFICLSCGHSVFAENSVTQSTTGDQGPAIQSEGDVTVTYGIPPEYFQKFVWIVVVGVILVIFMVVCTYIKSRKIAPPKGVSAENFQGLAEEFGVTKAALKNFFRIMEQKQVPPEDLDSTLRKIAGQYKELQNNLEGFQSDDPAVVKLKQKAKDALAAGELDNAEKFLNEAKQKDIAAAKALKEVANKRLLSAAASAAENGALKNTQLDYNGAASYYKEAAELVLAESELVLAGYLGKWGEACYFAGKYAEAEKPLKKALELREKIQGKEHKDVADCLNNMALLYDAQGKYKKAEPLYKHSLAIKEKVLGSEHPSLATTLSNLANLYRAQGRYDEAEPLYKRSLAIKEKVLGSEHPELATTLNNLAELYYAQGRYDEAEPLFKRDLAITEKVLGSEHPSFATTLSNLAGLYYAQGRYDEAEPLYKRSLAITEKVLGSEHPSLATTLNNLADLYKSQGRYDEAEPLYKRSLAIYEKVLGLEHPHVATACNNLAELYKSQGRYDEAEPLYRRALEIAEKTLGKDHPNVKTIRNNINLFNKEKARIQAEK